MSETLELPPPLSEEVEQEARKEGVTPSEHAVLLLYITTALLREPGQSPFQRAVKEFFREHSLDADRVASVFEELVRECLHTYGYDLKQSAGKHQHGLTSLDGMTGVLKEWRNWTVHHSPSYLDRSTTNSLSKSAEVVEHRPRKHSARGKYAHLRTSSEAFSRKKRDEVALEEGPGR